MWGYAARLALAILSLALLYHLGLLHFEELVALYDRPRRVIVSGLLLFTTIPLGALRWHLLLRCQGFHLPFRKTLSVVLVGQFFNTFLPGAYGGDIVRVGYIYHGARQQAGKLLLSVLVDRLSGLAGLVGLAFAAQLALPSVIDYRITALMVAIATAIVFGASLLPILGRWAARILRRFGGRFGSHLGDRILRLAMQIGIANEIYLGRADILAAAVLISALQFAFALMALVVLAGAFDFVTVSAATIVYAGIVSLIANSIPLTPGGIGVGEATFANAVILIDPAASGPYATIFLASRAVTLLLNLLGGFAFLAYRSEVIEYAAEAHSHREMP